MPARAVVGDYFLADLSSEVGERDPGFRFTDFLAVGNAFVHRAVRSEVPQLLVVGVWNLIDDTGEEIRDCVTCSKEIVETGLGAARTRRQ